MKTTKLRTHTAVSQQDVKATCDMCKTAIPNFLHHFGVTVRSNSFNYSHRTFDLCTMCWEELEAKVSPQVVETDPESGRITNEFEPDHRLAVMDEATGEYVNVWSEYRYQTGYSNLGASDTADLESWEYVHAEEVFEHFKGGKYVVLGVLIPRDGVKPVYVLYRALYGEQITFIRTWESWHAPTPTGKSRFKRVE